MHFTKREPRTIRRLDYIEIIRARTLTNEGWLACAVVAIGLVCVAVELLR